MHHPTDRIIHTTVFVTPVVEHWLERKIALAIGCLGFTTIQYFMIQVDKCHMYVCILNVNKNKSNNQIRKLHYTLQIIAASI